MEPPSTSSISIINHSGVEFDTDPARRGLAAALARHALQGEVALLFTTNEEIRDLNAKFRGKDEATDVLTFPAEDDFSPILGDIAVSVPFAQAQAAQRGFSLEQEVAYLAIHGGLHLAGLDDETEEDRDAMVREMNVVAGLSDLPIDSSWSSIHPEAIRS